jgi:cell division protein FtsL
LVLAQKKNEWQQPKQPKRKPAKRINRHTRLKSVLFLVLIVAVAGCIGAETLNLTVVKAAEIRQLEKDITALEANNDLLQVKIDQLRSIGHIESSALAMGMEKPQGTVYVSGNISVADTTAAKEEMGVPASGQEATPGTDKKNSLFEQFSQIIADFFA